MDASGLIKCFKALSDRTRLRLFNVLQQYELNVNEIVLVVGMIQSGVSRHLKILTESGLLTSRKDGSFTYFTAAKNSMTDTLIRMMASEKVADPVFEQDMEAAGEMIHMRQNRTRRFFKTVAPRWDRLKKEVFGAFDLNRVVMEKIEPGRVIADLGCGTGLLIEQLAENSAKKIIGIDSSQEMLEQARKRLRENTNIELRLGELEFLPVKDREIDTAIMNLVLYHISQPMLAVNEVFRVLKPGGQFLLSDFERHDHARVKELMGGTWSGFDKQQIQIWLADSGFKLSQVEVHPVNQDLAIHIFIAQKEK